MGPTWGLSAPDEPHVGPMYHAIRGTFGLITIQKQLTILLIGTLVIILFNELALIDMLHIIEKLIALI